MVPRTLGLLVATGCLFLTPAVRAEDPKADIAGTWDSNWGFVTFHTTPVKGKKVLAVTGSYLTGKDLKATIKSGTFDPATGVLEFAYEEPWRTPGKGTGRFTMAADGKSFKGGYQEANEKGDWNLTRLHGDSFTTYVDSIVANTGIKADTPGAAVLVIEGGKVVFQKGYGLANIKDKRHITPTTTFELASCSKQFTGAAILRLHEQGKLGLEDDVRKYLPELPEYDKKHPIRILDLVRHTSGLPEYFDLEDVKGKDPKFVTNEDYVGEYARQRKKHPLYFTPGEKSRYTNTNYMLLALIVERIAKKPFGAFMKSEFFEPLGMKTVAVYENPQATIKEPALGYHLEKGKFEDIWGPPPFRQETLLTVGDGGIWVSLEDMLRWDEGWRQGKVLKPETVKANLVPSKTRDGKDNNYAFGWIVTLDNGKLVRMGHGGSWGGFKTSVDRDLANDRTIIVLGNLESLDPGAIAGPIEHLCWAMPPKGK